jgi:hypothetical protein
LQESNSSYDLLSTNYDKIKQENEEIQALITDAGIQLKKAQADVSKLIHIGEVKFLEGIAWGTLGGIILGLLTQLIF